ncbi:MAG: hypothetical protein RSA49_00065 [Anaerovoracaceae bacterium]
MLNKILKAICKSLGEEFGEGYNIYEQKVEQGIKEPAFLVRAFKVEIQGKLFEIKKLRCSFEITHFCNDLALKFDAIGGMNESLRNVIVEDRPVKFFNVNIETNEDILHCFADCTLDICNDSNVMELMEEIVTERSIKDGE